MPFGNYSAPTGNITSGTDFFVWINSSINNLFFVGIVGAVFFIILVKLLFGDNSLSRSFTTSSFICFILATLLRVINLVGTPFVIMFIIFTIVGAIWVHVENAGRFA